MRQHTDTNIFACFVSNPSLVADVSKQTKDEPSDEMMKEMYAIACVHQRNSKAYGVNSEPAKDFRKKGESQKK